MTSQTTSIYTPFADGRPVRDIVEHTPALVNESWCRKLLAHTLDSLEQQYASGAPHRAITPDTLVMLANGEALLLPSIDETAATPSLADDLHALAQVVHYAITAELPPDGPLGPRLYDNYSEQLTKGLDCCLGPNRRLRPRTVDEMRTLLGIEAGAAELAPASGVAASAPAIVVADDAVAEPVQPRPADEVRATDAEPFTPGAAQQIAPPVAFVEPPSALDPAPMIPDEPVSSARAGGTTPPGPDFAAPVLAPLPVPNPVPEPAVIPAQDAASTLSVPQDAPAPAPLPATPEPVGLREGAAGALLRKPAGQNGPAGERHPARSTPIPAKLGDSAGPPPATPRKQSAAPAAAAPQAPYGSAPQAWTTTDRSSRAQRWGMLAGAAIVALAAGSALVSYLQQNDTRNLVPLSLPPAERAASGLDTGEAVVAPPPATTPADPALTPVEGAVNASDAPTGAPADRAAGDMLAPATAAGRPGEAVVNGTTYKLVIKPWGIVYVDGVDRGVSPPIKRLTLGPGQHTIRIVNPNFPEHIMTVVAGENETMIIEHDFTAKAE